MITKPYDPLGCLGDGDLVQLVLEAAEPWFNRHQKEWLEELVRRFWETKEQLDHIHDELPPI
jgi:hypothetical protein